MKIVTWVVVIGLGLAPVNTAAQTTARQRYLNLGEDPQDQNRQPNEDEEVVIIDHDLCDSGWGTGSGKKVPGCYPKNTAVIRKKATQIATAVFVCGNKPSDDHKVTGKVVAAGLVTMERMPSGEVRFMVEGIPTNVNFDVNVSGAVMHNVVHSGTVTVEERGTTTAQVDNSDGFPWKTLIGVVGGVVTTGLVIKYWPRGQGPRGVTGPWQ